VLETADDESGAEHEHAVREDRADQRRLDDLDQPVVQSEERDEELRQVAEPRLYDARAAGAQPRSQLLRRGADEARERGERDGRDEERRDVVQAGEMADPGQDDRKCRDRDLDAVPPGQAAEPTSPGPDRLARSGEALRRPRADT